MEIALITYVLTVLIPINGLIFLGMRRERQRMRVIALSVWKLTRK